MRLIDAEPYAGCRIVANREDSGVSIDGIKTVDAVPVVRCRECLYWQSGENEAEKWEYCRLHQIGIGPHSFCSYGERSFE